MLSDGKLGKLINLPMKLNLGILKLKIGGKVARNSCLVQHVTNVSRNKL